jgi:hypothetical protein
MLSVSVVVGIGSSDLIMYDMNYNDDVGKIAGIFIIIIVIIIFENKSRAKYLGY